MNNICHVEIPVTDLKKADEFYNKVFGFNINTEMLPNYGLVNEEEVSIGMPVVEKIEYPNTRLYIQVENIEKTLKLVGENGGETVSEKNKISDQIGFGAKFRDCFGNEVGLFAPE